MRVLFAVATMLALTAAAPVKDWRLTTGTSSVGGFTVGNPAARVKLTEYLSFTCSHCGEFVAESKAGLHDAMVRDGLVATETRSAARDPYDLAAWVVARCGGPKRFHSLSTAIFAQREAWTTKGEAYAQANLAAIKAAPQLTQIRRIADHSGLSAIAARAGVTPAALNQCFASDANHLKPILAMTEAAFAKLPGTPGFEINGQLVDGHDWAGLEPKLRAAGAR